MSWQVYVDSNLVGTGKVSRAAILGLAGGVWAKSPGYEITPEEQEAIKTGYKNNDAVLASGVRLCGQKYFTLSADQRSIYVKKGPDGVVIVKTTQAIIVAEYVAPTQAGEATTIVEGLADYLIGVGY